MKMLPSHREYRRARLRFTLQFYALMGIVVLVFTALVAGHYLLGWW